MKIEKYFVKFKVFKFINKYRAIKYYKKWVKTKTLNITQETFFKRLRKHYKFTDKEIKFVERGIN